jgi:hypothetical protein
LILFEADGSRVNCGVELCSEVFFGEHVVCVTI